MGYGAGTEAANGLMASVGDCAQQMKTTLPNASATITELTRRPDAVVEATAAGTVVILRHNKPCAYLVSVATYERMMDRLQDLELAELIRTRASERRVEIQLDDL